MVTRTDWGSRFGHEPPCEPEQLVCNRSRPRRHSDRGHHCLACRKVDPPAAECGFATLTSLGSGGRSGKLSIKSTPCQGRVCRRPLAGRCNARTLEPPEGPRDGLPITADNSRTGRRDDPIPPWDSSQELARLTIARRLTPPFTSSRSFCTHHAKRTKIRSFSGVLEALSQAQLVLGIDVGDWADKFLDSASRFGQVPTWHAVTSWCPS